jgi:hypothetical protein
MTHPTSAIPSNEWLRSRTQAIDRRLERALADPAYDALREAMGCAVRADRNRWPALALLAVHEDNGGAQGAALDAAVAIDLVDAAARAREQLPCIDRGRRVDRDAVWRRHGEAIAVLSTDGLLALAFEFACSPELPPAVSAQLCRLLAVTCGAPGLLHEQAKGAEDGLPPDIASLRIRRIRTTGTLLQTALCMGAVCAGVCVEAVSGHWIDPDGTWLAYGSAMGVACHVAEDIRRMQETRQPLHSWLRARDSMDFVAWLGIEGALSYLDRLRRQARAAVLSVGLPAGSRLAALTDAALEILDRDGAPMRLRIDERVHAHFIGDMRKPAFAC